MFFLALLLTALVALASALPLASRDVWVPAITSPAAGTVWAAGQTYAVTWDTTTEPSFVTNPNGAVYLRRNGATESAPLAQGFPLADGNVSVTIPQNTEPYSDWIIVLFGDSGNWSPPFTITSSSSSS